MVDHLSYVRCGTAEGTNTSLNWAGTARMNRKAGKRDAIKRSTVAATGIPFWSPCFETNPVLEPFPPEADPAWLLACSYSITSDRGRLKLKLLEIAEQTSARPHHLHVEQFIQSRVNRNFVEFCLDSKAADWWCQGLGCTFSCRPLPSMVVSCEWLACLKHRGATVACKVLADAEAPLEASCGGGSKLRPASACDGI